MIVGVDSLVGRSDQELGDELDRGVRVQRKHQVRMNAMMVPVLALTLGVLLTLDSGMLASFFIAGLGVCLCLFGCAFQAVLRSEKALRAAASELERRGRLEIIEATGFVSTDRSGYDPKLMTLLLVAGIGALPTVVYTVSLLSGGPEPGRLFSQIIMGGAWIAVLAVSIVTVVLIVRSSRSKR